MLTLVEAAADGVPRAWWESFLIVCGALVTVSAAAAIVVRVLRPHLETFVRKAVEPLVTSVEAVRAEVKPDHGDSLFDQARTAAAASTRLEETLNDLHDTTHAINRRLGKIDARVTMTRSVLDQHVREASANLSALREHYGIDVRIPRTSRTRHDDEETDL